MTLPPSVNMAGLDPTYFPRSKGGSSLQQFSPREFFRELRVDHNTPSQIDDRIMKACEETPVEVAEAVLGEFHDTSEIFDFLTKLVPLKRKSVPARVVSALVNALMRNEHMYDRLTPDTRFAIVPITLIAMQTTFRGDETFHVFSKAVHENNLDWRVFLDCVFKAKTDSRQAIVKFVRDLYKRRPLTEEEIKLVYVLMSAVVGNTLGDDADALIRRVEQSEMPEEDAYKRAYVKFISPMQSNPRRVLKKQNPVPLIPRLHALKRQDAIRPDRRPPPLRRQDAVEDIADEMSRLTIKPPPALKRQGRRRD